MPHNFHLVYCSKLFVLCSVTVQCLFFEAETVMNVILKFLLIVQGNVAMLASIQMIVTLLLFWGGFFFTMLKVCGLYSVK
jgi:hypothetical protein